MASQFRGWYFKCQSKEHTLALIPAIHQGPQGRECSLQLISPENSQTVSLPSQGAVIRWDRPEGQMNGFSFSPKGLTLNISTSKTRLRGQLSFGPPASLSQDIMGPFRYVPFLECRHRVYSMAHSVEGRLEWNGRIFSFSPGRGYIEGDQGHSFPKRYVWSQCLFPQGSLMLSVASIPLGPFSFTGVLALVRFLGQEYRLATYLNARAEKILPEEILIRQGPLTLQLNLLSSGHLGLSAPVRGQMSRLIRENITGHAHYALHTGDRCLLEVESHRASFEYEWSS